MLVLTTTAHFALYDVTRRRRLLAECVRHLGEKESLLMGPYSAYCSLLLYMLLLAMLCVYCLVVELNEDIFTNIIESMV